MAGDWSDYLSIKKRLDKESNLYGEVWGETTESLWKKYIAMPKPDNRIVVDYGKPRKCIDDVEWYDFAESNGATLENDNLTIQLGDKEEKIVFTRNAASVCVYAFSLLVLPKYKDGEVFLDPTYRRSSVGEVTTIEAMYEILTKLKENYKRLKSLKLRILAENQ